MDEKGLGKRLQEARQAAGLTQQALCQKANLSYSTLAKIERGAIKTPSIFTIQSIAGALGMTLDALIGTPVNTTGQLQHSKSGVSFVYFDINGCLVRFFQRAFTKIAEATGVPADTIETAYWHFNDEACRGTLNQADFNAALAERTGLDSIDWQEYYFAAIEPIEPMQELLTWTSQRYKVGIISNTMPGFINIMLSKGLLPNVSYTAIIDSSEVGSVKPEPRIYEIAAEKAGVPSEQILLIDDLSGNLIAAEKMGWHVQRFDDYQPEDSVEHLRESLEPAV
jgi:putative hydrolase of the HAD superfamily